MDSPKITPTIVHNPVTPIKIRHRRAKRAVSRTSEMSDELKKVFRKIVFEDAIMHQ